MSSAVSSLYRPPGRSVGLIAVTIAYTAFGLGLWLQPDRWAKTPAYALLLDLLPQQVWGTIYLVVAALLAAAVWQCQVWWLAVVAHSLGLALGGGWWIAFVIRWLTDDKTTVVNVVSWGTYVLLLVLSASLLERRRLESS